MKDVVRKGYGWCGNNVTFDFINFLVKRILLVLDVWFDFLTRRYNLSTLDVTWKVVDLWNSNIINLQHYFFSVIVRKHHEVLC